MTTETCFFTTQPLTSVNTLLAAEPNFAKQETALKRGQVSIASDCATEITSIPETSLVHFLSKTSDTDSVASDDLHRLTILKPSLSETPTQIKAESSIQKLMARLSECQDMLQKMDGKSEQPREIMEEIEKSVGALEAWVKNRKVQQSATLPIVPEVMDISAEATPKCCFFTGYDMNDDLNSDEGHDDILDQFAIANHDLTCLTTQNSNMTMNSPLAEVTKHTVEEFKINQRKTQEQAPVEDVSHLGINSLNSHASEVKRTAEFIPTLKANASESTHVRGTCLKKPQDKNKSSMKKNVSFKESTKCSEGVRNTVKIAKNNNKRRFGGGWD